ncbi:MAG: hypothetical protein IKX24_12235, partial [Prevotella sp.]|nr:hypothetical protein [Prevotella sp.]
MEALRNVNQVTLNFNLREPKKVSAATNVYAVIKLDGKQTKIAIGCKVNAWEWDGRKQMAKVQTNMTSQAIENAMQVNNVLNDVRMSFYSYLCSGEQVNVNELREILTINQGNDMANKNAIPPKRTRTASKLIKEAFEKYYAKKQGTEYYRVRKSIVKDFFAFLETPNVYDSVRTLSVQGMFDYKEYLISQATDNNKEISHKTI